MASESPLKDLNTNSAQLNEEIMHFNKLESVQSGDLSRIYEDQLSELNEWKKKEKINIAIIGQSRQGKSSFINALMGRMVALVGDLGPTTKKYRKLRIQSSRTAFSGIFPE